MLDPPRLSPAQRKALAKISAQNPVLLSDISLWEIALLHELGRITLNLPLLEWLKKAASPPDVQIMPITPEIAAETASLPDSFHRDPADRIIVATARILGESLMTSDAGIIRSGLVTVI